MVVRSVYVLIIAMCSEGALCLCVCARVCLNCGPGVSVLRMEKRESFHCTHLVLINTSAHRTSGGGHCTPRPAANSLGYATANSHYYWCPCSFLIHRKVYISKVSVAVFCLYCAT